MARKLATSLLVDLKGIDGNNRLLWPSRNVHALTMIIYGARLTAVEHTDQLPQCSLRKDHISSEQADLNPRTSGF